MLRNSLHLFAASALAGVAIYRRGCSARDDQSRARHAAHRGIGPGRKTGRSRRPPLYGAARRHGRRPQDRADRQGRRQPSRQFEADNPGADRLRQGRHSGRRPDAERAGHRAVGQREQDGDGGHGLGDVDRHGTVALFCPHELDPRPASKRAGQLGGEERIEARHHHRVGLGAGA